MPPCTGAAFRAAHPYPAPPPAPSNRNTHTCTRAHAHARWWCCCFLLLCFALSCVWPATTHLGSPWNVPAVNCMCHTSMHHPQPVTTCKVPQPPKARPGTLSSAHLSQSTSQHCVYPGAKPLAAHIRSAVTGRRSFSPVVLHIRPSPSTSGLTRSRSLVCGLVQCAS